MALKMIQLGTGGWGGCWCERFLPPNVEDGFIEVVAAADVNPEALANAQRHLGLDASRCYTDPARAIAENDADFCAIVVPPSHHEELVDLVQSVRDAVDLGIMVSPGALPESVFPRLREAGADWFACYQETYNKELFKKLRLEQDFQNHNPAMCKRS